MPLLFALPVATANRVAAGTQTGAPEILNGSIEHGASGAPIFSKDYDAVLGIVFGGYDGDSAVKNGHTLSAVASALR